MILLGKASPNGTIFTAQSHSKMTYKSFSNTDLTVSQVGFGCYRIDPKQKVHEQALKSALTQGINLIDTSSNYGDGGSELLVGSVLKNLVEQNTLARENVIVVSKVGYLQGQNYELAQQRKKEGRPFPNLVKYQTGLDHCIHPEFIEDQLTRSLERLQLETIDCYLLHNPEYYLMWAKVANIPLPEARQEYYRRIRLAFQHLEKEVEQGRIQWYGISSNTFPVSSKNADFTSLEVVWEIANDISPDHHFRVVQMPFNLMETGAVTNKNLPGSMSTLAFAHEKNLAVLINRPLNAYFNNILTRLADVLTPSYPTTVEEVSTTVDSLIASENEFVATWLPKLEIDAETNGQLQEYLAVGHTLEGRWQGFGSYHNWRDIRGQFLLPRAQAAIEFLSNQSNLPDMQSLWLSGYVDLVNETVAAISAFYEEQGHQQARMLQETAVSTTPDWHTPSLSKTAVRALRSTQGVTCTLVGMRHPHYVEDILSELKQPVDIKNRDASWQEIKEKTENNQQ